MNAIADCLISGFCDLLQRRIEANENLKISTSQNHTIPLRGGKNKQFWFPTKPILVLFLLPFTNTNNQAISGYFCS